MFFVIKNKSFLQIFYINILVEREIANMNTKTNVKKNLKLFFVALFCLSLFFSSQVGYIVKADGATSSWQCTYQKDENKTNLDFFEYTYKFRKITLTKSIEGIGIQGQDLVFPKDPSFNEIYQYFAENRVAPIHFKIIRTAGSDSSTGVCLDSPWAGANGDRESQRAKLIENEDNKFNYCIYDASVNEDQKTLTVSFIVDEEKLSYDSCAVSATPYTYSILEDYSGANYLTVIN